MLSSFRVPSSIDEPISVNVLIPRNRVRVFSLLRSSNIALLKTALPNMDFIFNGQLLEDNCTLDFYNIQPNDSIVALPSNPGTGQVERWMRITRDADAFSDCVRSLVSKKSRSESLRLHDLRAMRIESRPRVYRRLCEAERNAPMLSSGKTCPTVVPGREKEVSTAPLPMCW
jgi:hypothetical protein